MSDSAETFRHEILEGMDFSIRLHVVGDDGERDGMDLSVTGVHRDKDGYLVGYAIAVDDDAMNSEGDTVRVPDTLVLVEGGPAVVEGHEDNIGHKPLISKKLAAAIGGAAVVGLAIGVPFIARRKKS